MDALGIVGLIVGLLSLAVTAALSVSQDASLKITSTLLENHLLDIQGHLITRLDRLDATAERILTAVAERGP